LIEQFGQKRGSKNRGIEVLKCKLKHIGGHFDAPSFAPIGCEKATSTRVCYTIGDFSVCEFGMFASTPKKGIKTLPPLEFVHLDTQEFPTFFSIPTYFSQPDNGGFSFDFFQDCTKIGGVSVLCTFIFKKKKKNLPTRTPSERKRLIAFTLGHFLDMKFLPIFFSHSFFEFLYTK
jgi:hypothetical protein